jgi:hypothetical protein
MVWDIGGHAVEASVTQRRSAEPAANEVDGLAHRRGHAHYLDLFERRADGQHPGAEGGLAAGLAPRPDNEDPDVVAHPPMTAPHASPARHRRVSVLIASAYAERCGDADVTRW